MNDFDRHIAEHHDSVEVQPADAITALRRSLEVTRIQLAAVVMTARPGPHRTAQRRDRRPPWCAACGRTAEGEQIKEVDR